MMRAGGGAGLRGAGGGEVTPPGRFLARTHFMMRRQMHGRPGKQAGADHARQRDAAHRKEQPPPAGRENSVRIMARPREIPHGRPPRVSDLFTPGSARHLRLNHPGHHAGISRQGEGNPMVCRIRPSRQFPGAGAPAAPLSPGSARHAARWRRYGIKCPGAGVVSSGCSKLVRQPLPGWPHGAAGWGLAGHRGRAPYADRRADRIREDAGRVPGLHRPDLPGARGGSGARGGAPGRVRVAAEGAGHRHLAEPRSPAG